MIAYIYGALIHRNCAKSLIYINPEQPYEEDKISEAGKNYNWERQKKLPKPHSS